MKAAPPMCQGPDRRVRAPTFKIPRGSWDTHAHVFGPGSRFPYSPARSYTPEDCTAGQHLAMLDMLGFDYGVVVQGGAHGVDNAAMLDALARAPDRLRGVAVIAPGLGDSALQALDEQGVRGVRMSTVVGGGVSFDALEALAAETHPLGWHLMLHFHGALELVDIEATLRRVRSPFILDHMARITGAEGITSTPFKTLLRLLDTDRCWVKLASLYRLSQEPYPHLDMLPMIHAVVAARPDRILWGSNWPHPIHKGIMPHDADLVDQVPRWVPDERARRLMLVENPADLYGRSFDS